MHHQSEIEANLCNLRGIVDFYIRTLRADFNQTRSEFDFDRLQVTRRLGTLASREYTFPYRFSLVVDLF
mgnify:CR=1 FL=1